MKYIVFLFLLLTQTANASFNENENSLLETNCDYIEITNLSNAQKKTIYSEKKNIILSLFKNKSIKPSSEDYEIAKVNFVCNFTSNQLSPQAFIYYSPFYKSYFVSIEIGGKVKYLRLEKEQNDILLPFLQ